MLTEPQLNVLLCFAETPSCNQRGVAEATSLSLGLADKTINELKELGFLGTDGTVTAEGRTAMDAYRVQGAVILAAGVGSRMAPLSFDRPKALFRVGGEVLIERLIRQLQECGIDDITVVVGYMRESLFYLKDRFGVRILTYNTRGNHESFMTAKDYVADAYICSSDEYFAQSPFQSHVLKTTCTLVPAPYATGEYALSVNRRGTVSAAKKDDPTTCLLMGPIYLDNHGAETVARAIEAGRSLPDADSRFWEQYLIDHLDSIKPAAHVMPAGTVHEFNYLNDLVAFDHDYIENVDLDILDNICGLFHCARSDISDIRPLKEGLTNLSFLFSVRGDRYVYRHPGNGTDSIINREAEEHSLTIAKKMGLDQTFVYEDAKKGWKVSRYVSNCIPFDYSNTDHVKKALAIARKLHESGANSPWSYNPYLDAQRIVELLKQSNYRMPTDFEELSRRIDTVAKLMAKKPTKPVLCHNDFYGPNLLVHPDGEMDLIDWEYSAMGDYGNDIGNFISQGSGYSVEQALGILPYYFGRQPTVEEIRHCMSCTAIVGYYWYVWAMYKEVQGNPVGKWLDIWYDATKTYGKYALGLYEDNMSYRSGDLTEDEFTALVKKYDAGTATDSELAALEPYRAKRAVLLASGFGSRLLPVTTTIPKPLVKVHGKRIICTILDALVAAGVDDIVIVRGYLADAFDCLLADYPQVRFVDNPIYDTTNNITSALAAALDDEHAFENAYVFESDLFLKNPDLIKRYQYRSNYLGVPVDSTPDWCFDVNGTGRIMDLHKGGHNVHHMYGVAYWTAEEGRQLAQDLQSAFADEDNRQRFWDDVPCVLYHDNYRVYVRDCTFDDIAEVDSYDELCQIDPSYKPSSN